MLRYIYGMLLIHLYSHLNKPISPQPSTQNTLPNTIINPINYRHLALSPVLKTEGPVQINPRLRGKRNPKRRILQI